jgi:hypothetical protein
MQDVDPAENLSTPYSPVAVYYEQADSLEYVRRDGPSVYRRVDGFLTLILNMRQRDEVIGFQLKGFKNFYLRDGVAKKLGQDFPSLVGILERALTEIGGEVVDAIRQDAYARARKIALEDAVEVHDLPKVACN